MNMLRSIAVAAVSLPLAFAATAQEKWPTKTVTLVAHSSPGGGNDIMARNLGPALEKKHGISVVVQNRTGGSGAVAANYMATQAPRDGYTLQMVTPTQLITPLRSKGIPTYKDMTPIAGMLMDPTTLYVHRDSQFKSIKELVDYAKKNPRKLTIGIGSAGSLDQLVLENFQKAAGIEVRTVPHEGGGAAVVSLLGKHVDAVIGEPGQALTHLQNGTLNMLVVFQDSRLKNYQAPTARENGWDVVSTKFRGVFAPPGVPQQTVDAIVASLKDIYETEPFRSYYLNGSLEPVFIPHKEFVAFLDRANTELEAFLATLPKKK